MARTHAVEERVTYAVTSRCNRRGVASDVLCGSAPRSLLRSCAVNISVAVNQHASIKEAVFSVGAAPSLYNEDLTQLELELSRVLELAVAAEDRESRQSKVIENSGEKGIRLCKEDFIYSLKLQ
jgi:hypothetical protein